MTSINFRFLTGRSLQASALMLILTAATVAPATPAFTQTLTWQNALARLFGRQQQKGGTRGPSFCSVSPASYRVMPRSEGARLFNSAANQRLLTDKPLILWYGNISSIRIRNRSIPSAQPVVIPIPVTKLREKKNTILQKAELPPTLNRLQYDGEALLPDQDYEIRFMSLIVSSDASKDSSKKEVENEAESYRFRTVSQADRDRLNRQLQDLAAKAAKTNSDPTLSQVEFLLEQNLVNDAQMLISQQPNPSPELAAAIEASQNPCEKKLKIKEPKIKTPTPSNP